MSIPVPIVLLDARANYVHPAFEMGRGSTRTAFDRTGRLVTHPVQAMAWEHEPASGQVRGYSAERSGINLISYSEDLGQASVWSGQRATLSPSSMLGPNGLSPLFKLAETNAGGTHFTIVQPFSASHRYYCFSCVAAPGERSECEMRIFQDGAFVNYASARFNLLNGTRSWSAAGTGVYIDSGSLPLGNGLWRIWVAGQVDVGGPDLGVRLDLINQGQRTYVGDGASGIHMGFAQLEQNPFPTSYISTNGASQVRNSDHLVMGLGNHRWWNPRAGTIVTTFSMRHPNNVGGRPVLYLDEALGLIVSSSRNLQLAGGAVEDLAAFGLPDGSRRYCSAVAWEGAFAAITYGGVAPLEATLSGDLSAVGSFGLGARPLNQGFSGLLDIERCAYYPVRPSNADLQSLTAIQE